MSYTADEFAAKYDALTDEQKDRLSGRVDMMTANNAEQAQREARRAARQAPAEAPVPE